MNWHASLPRSGGPGVDFPRWSLRKRDGTNSRSRRSPWRRQRSRRNRSSGSHANCASSVSRNPCCFPSEWDWLAELAWVDEVEGLRPCLEAFRQDVQRWARAVVLPVDELLLTFGNDLFVSAGDLALTHHLAVMLAKLAEDNPSWRLPQLAAELERIAQNRRRMIGFDEAGEGFTPQPGVVTVATMHGAKGLEWDRVYLMAVNTYSFPSGDDDEKYRGEPYWARDKLNLVAEAIAQVEQLRMGSLDDYTAGKATRAARRAAAAERLRLLYVGITRARRELIVTYNTGLSEQDPAGPAVAFEALKA